MKAPEPACWPSRPFRPAWWLRGAHAQTLAGRLLRRIIPPELTTERIETSDGDFFDVEWGVDPGPEAPICIVLHGLEGNARRPYALMLHRELLERSIRPLGLHFRSCSGEPNRTARFYHSGETSDLDHLVRIVEARHPRRPLLAVGFSLGGNVLLKYLGELGEDGPGVFRGCAAISVPFDLAAGTEALESSWIGRRVYARYFVRSLLAKVRSKRDLLRDRLDMAKLLQARSLREFDEAATVPLHGFRDANDYYSRASSWRYLSAIRVPTGLIQALDDPFLPPRALPTQEIASNPHLVPAFSLKGGHVGFVEGGPAWNPRYWAEEEAARFVAGYGLAAMPRRHAGRAGDTVA